MDLRRLRYFAAVASLGSVHRAAAELGIAQPALSRQIRELEEELGVTLFARSTRGVTLSPVGEVLLSEVDRLLPQVEVAKARTQRAAQGQFGLLRVAFTTVAAELRFPVAAFAEARRLMPEVEFRLSLIDSDHQLEALVAGEIDLGLVYRRGELPEGMRYQDLRVDRYILMVPNDHPLTRQASVRMADLRDHDMIFASKATLPLTYADHMAACARGGFTPRVALELHNEAITLNLVAEGLAISFANSSLRERRPMQGVTYLEIDDFDSSLPLAAMWRRDRETAATLRFVDLLVSNLARESGG
jgi:DNA-binding transcriptional LysR family regulator